MKQKIFLVVLASWSLFSCTVKKDDDYFLGGNKGPKLSDLISFSITGDSLVADSSSRMQLSVKISPNADSVNRYISFRTNMGKFDNNDSVMTVFANSYGIASVSIFGNTSGNALVHATIGTLSIDTIIRFLPALPGNMLLSADNYAIDSTDSLHVTSQLFRNSGVVSSGTVVHFSAGKADTAARGNIVIPDFAISHNGIATATVKNPFVAHGKFTINAYTLSQTNDTIKRSILISIK